MGRPTETLEHRQKSSLVKSNFNFLELIVFLFVVSLIVLAFVEPIFRADLKEIAMIVISGYLGNKVPR